MTLEIQKMTLDTRRENAVSSLWGSCKTAGMEGTVDKGNLHNALFLLASFDDRLEDDDFDLIEENLGVKVKRGVSVIILSTAEMEKPLKFSDSYQQKHPEQIRRMSKKRELVGTGMIVSV